MKKFFSLSFVAALAMLFVACSSTSTPSGAAENYVKALQAKDFSAITEMMFVKEGTPEEDVAQQKAMVESILTEKGSKTIDKHEGISSYTIGEETISEDGNSATVVVDMVYGDGSTDDNEVKLKKSGEEWMLDLSK